MTNCFSLLTYMLFLNVELIFQTNVKTKTKKTFDAGKIFYLEPYLKHKPFIQGV